MKLLSLLMTTMFAFAVAAAEPATVHEFKVKDIQGKEVDLAQYRDKVLLIVNVASKCGYTRQYKGLQALYETYGDRGLAILAFPANDFGSQEPGSNQEIAAFCTKNFGVTFDMFEKITVKGDQKAPLFGWLTSQPTEPEGAGEISWNFNKFLVAKDGTIIARYSSKVEPESETLTAAIEKALAE